MRLVALRKQDLYRYTIDKEMLHKAGRPCVLIVNLLYKKRRLNFAVPIRSNINPSTPKRDYFALPPRSTTRPKCRHGIHYAKMFPIDKRMAVMYRTAGNDEETLCRKIIDANEKQIIKECQAYLERYENGDRTCHSTDIDLLLERAMS